nr:hypothetical protein Q903MT_gene6236 [Picea sitchensis]
MYLPTVLFSMDINVTMVRMVVLILALVCNGNIFISLSFSFHLFFPSLK